VNANRWNRFVHKLTLFRDGWKAGREAESPRGLAFRLGLVMVIALLTLILFPPESGYEVPVVRVGVVASEDVLAPFDFPVLRDEGELEELQERAAISVPPVFSHEPALADSAVAEIDAYLSRFEVDSPSSVELAQLNRINGRSVGLRPVEQRALTDARVRAEIRSLTRQILPAVYVEHLMLQAAALSRIPGTQVSVVRPDGSEAVVPRSEIIALRPGAEIPALRRLSPIDDAAVQRIADQLLPAVMPANLEPHPSLTALRRTEARRTVSPVKSEVLEGELIVAEHTRVTPEQAEQLRSLSAELSRRRGGFTVDDVRAALGSLFLGVVLLFLFGFFLFMYRGDVFGDYRAVGVLTMIWALVAGLTTVFDRVEAIPVYAAPIAFGSVTVAILWNARLSVPFTLFMAVYLSAQVDPGFPLLWTGIVAGLSGAWSVRRIRRRTHFYESLLFIIVGYAIAVTALGLTQFWGWGEFITALGWGALSAGLAVFLAMGVLPVLEWASGRTTDLTLLELADLNRPLLKELLLQAPGSYHHSIIVGNLAEAATEGIGANSLLARVGAYYHDIGKMMRPEYFAENQRGGVNPHTSLTPEASARIVSRHVHDGIEMATAAGLPEDVIDFIREHHGTTRLTYFWHKAEQEERTDQPTASDFVYPGPRPRSKETAVVMLADSVEAACRVVSDPSPESFRKAVRRIVDMKLDEHQLDEADLTFRDLAIVRDKFVSVLGGIHHHRIDYPTVSLHAPEVRDEPSDPLSSAGRTPV
jgi:putative nucleotidyltransferase with HDIG domain